MGLKKNCQMAKKQFEAKTIRADKRADWVVGIFDNGVLINNFGVAHTLNELTEENEQLKSTVKYLKNQLKAYSELCPNGRWILNQGDLNDQK